jgi:6-pyruvoyltetrahydropterin/6-carboxytetrahydropterin synthase
MFELVFSRRFSMAHRLLGGSAKCTVPHGHNEIVRVHLRSTRAAALDGGRNMVVPFEDAKRRWHKWIDSAVDHAFQLSQNDPLLAYLRANESATIRRVMVTPGDPTTELTAALFKAKLEAFLKADQLPLECHRIEIEETPTNAVILEGPSTSVLPITASSCWWTRSDDDINDEPASFLIDSENIQVIA